MADLIDRQELKKRYIATAQSGGYLGNAIDIAINHLTRLLCLIDEAPAVEVKKGQWDDSGKYAFANGSTAVRCSECGCSLTVGEYNESVWNFCPVCGADMRGERNA